MGDPFQGSLSGPGYESLKAGMEEAYGRELTTEGQGGSIPLCNVFAETYPDAEIMLMGVEEPKCLIHAPNESVDPSEIEHIALAEALFLEQLREGGAMTVGRLHRRRTSPSGSRARSSRPSAREPRRRVDHARPGSRLLHGLPPDGDHRADHAAGRAAGP